MAFNIEAEGTGVVTEQFVGKTIVPGKHKLMINSIELDHKKFEGSNGKPGDEGDYLILNVETEPIEGEFEGFLIDKDDASKGRYKGQIGKVKYSRSLYKGVTRDDLISAAIMTLCRAAGIEKELKVLLAGKTASVEKVIEAINNKHVFKDKFMFMIVGGKEYFNKKNYINHELYLAYPKDGKLTLGTLTEENSLLDYDPVSMIIPVKKSIVDTFSTQDSSDALLLSDTSIGSSNGLEPIVDDLPF